MSFITNIQYPHNNTWDKDKIHTTFTLKNIHYSLANAIRRAAISCVETIGFRSEPSRYSTIKITRNDTILNNQQISHRIAMLPINVGNLSKFDVDDFEFILDEVNNTNNIKLVTSENFKVKRISTNKFLSDKEVRQLLPPCPLSGDFIPIVKLEPKYYTNLDSSTDLAKNINEAIKVPVSEPVGISLTAKCVKSNGVENGHFSPIAVCVYGNTQDEEKVRQGELAFIEEQNSYATANDLTPISEDKLRRRFYLNEVQRFYQVDEYGDPNSFDFKVESVGVIPPLIIIARSMEVITEKINNLIINLSNPTEDKLEIEPTLTMGNGFKIVVDNEDDTLGNVVQSYLSRMFADYSLPPEERKLVAITYHKTHPLKQQIIFTIKPVDDDFGVCIENVIIPGCKNIIKLINNIKLELMDTKQYLDEAKLVA